MPRTEKETGGQKNIWAPTKSVAFSLAPPPARALKNNKFILFPDGEWPPREMKTPLFPPLLLKQKS